MKKIIQVLVVACLLAVIGPLSTHAKSNAPNGFYLIEAGKEQYISIPEFKILDKQEKKKMIQNKWFIVSGGSVYPSHALLATSEELVKLKEDKDDFEEKYKVDLEQIASEPVDEDFQVEDIS